MAPQVFDFKRLIRSFAGVSALYMLGVPLLLAANIILARTLSVAEFGAFGFAIAVATVLAIPVLGGLPMLLTREVAGYTQQQNWPFYRGMIVCAYRWVAAISAVIAVALVLWWLLARATPRPELLIACVLVPFLGLRGIRNGILKGLGRPVLAEAPVQVLQPLLMIAGYLALAALGLASARNALWWYLAVVMVVFVIASVMQMRVQPVKLSTVQSDMTDLPRWRAALLPFAMMSAATVLSTQIAVLLLGLSGQEEAVAQMRVAERGAQLVAFPLTFINTILGPYFVHALKSDDSGALRKITRQSARLTLLASLPVAIILLVYGRTLIGWTFGAPYDLLSYGPMAILIVAQLVSVSLGSAGMLLTMSGHEKLALYSHLAGLVITSVAVALLGTSYGAVGAAVGVAIGVVAAKLILYALAKQRLSISSGIF